jgi:hypothetical protein
LGVARLVNHKVFGAPPCGDAPFGEMKMKNSKLVGTTSHERR